MNTWKSIESTLPVSPIPWPRANWCQEESRSKDFYPMGDRRAEPQEASSRLCIFAVLATEDPKSLTPTVFANNAEPSWRSCPDSQPLHLLPGTGAVQPWDLFHPFLLSASSSCCVGHFNQCQELPGFQSLVSCLSLTWGVEEQKEEDIQEIGTQKNKMFSKVSNTYFAWESWGISHFNLP